MYKDAGFCIVDTVVDGVADGVGLVVVVGEGLGRGEFMVELVGSISA
jgi:hypothetical protein